MHRRAGLRVELFGAFRVSRGDTAFSVPGSRLQGLAARLALAGGRSVGRDDLIDAIWADAPPADPAHALQTLVSRLRRTLGSAEDVAQVAGGYRLAVDTENVDALRFEQLAAEGRDRLRSGDPIAAAALLGEAVALWSDRPGAEPAVVAAVDPDSATRLARLSIEAATDLADAELAQGKADEAASRLSAVLADHSGHERAAALLMDALVAEGREAEALTVYERTREALADLLGADPGTALRDRHLRLLRAEAPADPTGPSNLPAPLTSFIGRDGDLARIDMLLAGGRLVTVLGPGGAGKTRLAVEAARRREYCDGPWMVDLASVTEPAKVGMAVLAAIGLRGSALFESSARLRGDRVGELDVLADRLGDKESLLVVDNCEHLVDAVAHLVAALLARCPGLRVLSTSREPLAIDGEALVQLGPLALPEAHASVEQARAAASVRLFSERAASLRPFEVDERNLADVLRIVRSLDGMPLALELAAARLRTLSLTDLAAGLADRFRLLTTGSRTALPRHRTLGAVIAWSWDLLDPEARTVAECIAVLPGGVAPDSAAAVCSVPADAVRESLAALVDRSLLQLSPDTGRYRMLETIREYGLERLAERDALGDTRNRAARHFGELAAACDPLLRGPGQLAALHTLRVEHDNVLSSLRHRCDTGDVAGAIRLAIDLAWYWQLLGLHTDAAYWLDAAVALPGRSGRERDVAEGLLLVNRIATETAPTGDPAEDRRETARALTDKLLRHPEPSGFGGSLALLKLAALDDNEASQAIIRRLADEPDAWLAGLAHMVRAQSTENEGRLDQVRTDVTEALACFARAGDRWGRATALPLRALLRQYEGDLEGALSDLDDVKQLASEFGSLSLGDEVFIELRRIDLYVRLGEDVQAARLVTATRERALGSASPELAILLDAREADLRMRTGDLDQAQSLVASAEAGLSEQVPLGGDHGRALVGTVRAALCLELGDRPGAIDALEQAYAAAVETKDMPTVATVAVAVAGLAARDGRYSDAAEILGAAARLRGAHDHTDPQVRELSDSGRAAIGDERFDTAYTSAWRLDATAALEKVNPHRPMKGPRSQPG